MMANYVDEVPEKPYDFVSLPDLERFPDGKLPRKRPVGHARYDGRLLSGTLEGRIELLSPLHIASGHLELTERVAPRFARDTSLIHEFMRTRGRRIIPGSSLKGAIRSVVEAVSPSCIRVTRARFGQQPDDLRACRRKEQLCLACRMFGAMGHQGQVRFADAPQTKGGNDLVWMPAMYAPRRNAPRYRGADDLVIGRKFYKHGRLAEGHMPVEVCPTGSLFDLRVDFVNLTEQEIGLLILCMGYIKGFHPKLGGRKPACAGSASLRLHRATVVRGERDYLEYAPEPETVDPMPWIRAAYNDSNYVIQSRLRDLMGILKHPNERDCPAEMY